jgi:uncharacterized membrane protein
MRDFNAGPAPAEFNPATEVGRFFNWLVAGVALVNYALVFVTLVTQYHLPGKPDWPEATLVFTATLTTMVALSRQLSFQNALLAGTIIAGIGTAAHFLAAATSIPFGPIRFTDAAGPKLFDLVSWAMPMLWIIVVLNSRGVARLILRPWRKIRAYGFWLIGLTVVLTTLLIGALEPFGGAVKRYWLWEPTRLPFTWSGAPITNFLGWLVVSLLIMAFAAPALIDKRARPVKRTPDFHPLVSWLLALALFATAMAQHQLWLPFAYCTGLAIVTTTFAWRGARW